MDAVLIILQTFILPEDEADMIEIVAAILLQRRRFYCNCGCRLKFTPSVLSFLGEFRFNSYKKKIRFQHCNLKILLK